jgi:hypothetical protein
MRVAEQDGHLYLDLADEHWRAVEIGPEGWRVVASPPVRFRRAAGMLPLPVPVKGGSIDDLAPFLNLPSRSEFVLVVAWLLAAFRHGAPYPLLALSGEQGSAKTVLSKILKAAAATKVAVVQLEQVSWCSWFGSRVGYYRPAILATSIFVTAIALRGRAMPSIIAPTGGGAHPNCSILLCLSLRNRWCKLGIFTSNVSFHGNTATAASPRETPS